MPGTLLEVELRQVEWGDSIFKMHDWDWGISPFILRGNAWRGNPLNKVGAQRWNSLIGWFRLNSQIRSYSSRARFLIGWSNCSKRGLGSRRCQERFCCNWCFIIWFTNKMGVEMCKWLSCVWTIGSAHLFISIDHHNCCGIALGFQKHFIRVKKGMIDR